MIKFLLFTLIVFKVSAGEASECESGLLRKVTAQRSLFITNPSVVDSEMTSSGPLSFGQVFIDGARGASDAGLQAFRMFDTYRALSYFNGFFVGDRTAGPLFNVWPMAYSRPERILEKTPFRLLAIAFRLDLASAKDAGEVRFIYGAYEPSLGVRDLTVNFEYALPFTPSHPKVLDWARGLAALSDLEYGPEYESALLNLVGQFLRFGRNLSTLKRIHVNEQLFGSGWDLREFVFDESSKQIVLNTLKKSPDISLNTELESDLVRWLNDNEASVVRGDYELPFEFQAGRGFLPDDGFRWFEDNPFVKPSVKQALNIQTCVGCHGAGTRTEFMHVEPRSFGEESRISDFVKAELVKRKDHLISIICRKVQ